MPKNEIMALCTKWKKELFKGYPVERHNDLLNVLSIFVLNRFRNLFAFNTIEDNNRLCCLVIFIDLNIFYNY